MVQGESKDASLLVILAEPQPIFSKKKYTHDRAQIDLSELLEPPYKNNSFSFLSLQRGSRCATKRLRRSPIPLAPAGQTATQRIHPMHNALLLAWGVGNEMAPVGHSSAQVPQLVQASVAVGNGPVLPCL